jgi:MFS family permease
MGGLVKLRLSALSPFSRDTRLLFAVSGMLSVSFFGVQMLLKVLYVLRLGYGPEFVGWFLASSALAYMAMGLPSGALGARFGTRRIMLVGGICAVVGMATLPLTEYVPPWADTVWPIGSQMILTMGWSMFSVNLIPTLTAVTTEQNRAGAYSLNAVLQGAGTFVGTLSGGLLPGMFARLLGESPDAPGPYGYALWVGAALALVAILPLTFVGNIEAVAAEKQEGKRGPFPLWPIFSIVVYVYVRHAGWATGRAFANAYMDTELHLSTASIGLITSVGQFLAILAPLLNPRLAVRRSNGWIVLMTTLGIAASLVPLALIPHWTAVAAGRLVFVVLSAIWLPALQAFHMDRVGPQWRSIAYGALAMAMGSGFGTMSLAGGYVVAAAGYRTLFALGVVLSLIAAALMWGILRHQSRQTAQSPVPDTDRV